LSPNVQHTVNITHEDLKLVVQASIPMNDLLKRFLLRDLRAKGHKVGLCRLTHARLRCAELKDVTA
jgi:hypothetical protein